MDVDDLLGPHSVLVAAEVVDHSVPAAFDHECITVLASVHRRHDRLAVGVIAQGDGVSRTGHQERIHP